MPVRVEASGSVVSLDPPLADFTLSNRSSGECRPGNAVASQVGTPVTVLFGTVVKALDGDKKGSHCEARFSKPFPATVELNGTIDAMISVAAIHDAVFLARPAKSAPHSEATILRLEPNKQFARRVKVRYGQISGPDIQVLSGLAPGDRVIVTDVPGWAARKHRVRVVIPVY